MANNVAFAPEMQELTSAVQALSQPQALYPPYTPARPTPLTQEERLEVRYWKEIQHGIMHDTPFYIQTKDRASRVSGDGIDRYSDRWKPKRKAALSLLDLRTDESYFPEELHIVLRGDVPGRKKRKQQTFDVKKFLDSTKAEDDQQVVEFDDADDLADIGIPVRHASDDDGEADEEVEQDEAFSDDGNDYEDNYFDGGDDDVQDDGPHEETY